MISASSAAASESARRSGVRELWTPTARRRGDEQQIGKGPRLARSPVRACGGVGHNRDDQQHTAGMRHEYRRTSNKVGMTPRDVARKLLGILVPPPERRRENRDEPRRKGALGEQRRKMLGSRRQVESVVGVARAMHANVRSFARKEEQRLTIVSRRRPIARYGSWPCHSNALPAGRCRQGGVAAFAGRTRAAPCSRTTSIGEQHRRESGSGPNRRDLAAKGTAGAGLATGRGRELLGEVIARTGR